MAELHIGIEVRDFDLERIGFSLSVLDESGKRQLSEGYLRMSLQQLGAFVDALKGAGDLAVTTFDSDLNRPKMPTVELGPLKRTVVAE